MAIAKQYSLANIYVPLILFAMTATTFAISYLIKIAFLRYFHIPYEHYAFNLNEMVGAGVIVTIYTATLSLIIFFARSKAKKYDDNTSSLFKAGIYLSALIFFVSAIQLLTLDRASADRLSSLVNVIQPLVGVVIVIALNSLQNRKLKQSSLLDKLLMVLNKIIDAIRDVLEVIFVFAVIVSTAPVVATAIGQTVAKNTNTFYKIENSSLPLKPGEEALVIYEGSDKVLAKPYNTQTNEFGQSYFVLEENNLTLTPKTVTNPIIK